MTTLLPKDSDNNPIPALRLKQDAAHAIGVSATSTRNTTAFDAQTRVISLYSTAPLYIAFGDNTITADSTAHFFPAGIYYDVAIGGGKNIHTPYLAVIRAEYDGTLYISEKE